MLRRWLRRAGNVCWVAFFVVSFFGVPTHASTQRTISEPTDLWFDYAEPVVFTARTYSQNDPQLWLYDEAGELVAVNDDYFGLDSWLEVELPAGRYRLRAGRCCGNPDFWWGSAYTLEINSDPVEPTTTTTTMPATTTTTTTSTTTTTTTMPEVTSTTTTTTEPTPEVTTTWPESTTSTTTTSTTAPIASVPATTELPTTTEPATTSIPTPSPTVVPSLGPTVSPTSTSTSSIAPTTTVTVDTTTTTIAVEDAPTTSIAELPPDADATAIVEYLADLSTDELASLTPQELDTIIEDIANVDLTDEQAEAIAQALSGAPIEVKQAFEAQVDIFSGQFDSYVPAGSNVSVTVRRTIVAVTGLSMLPLTPVSAGSAGARRRQTR